MKVYVDRNIIGKKCQLVILIMEKKATTKYKLIRSFIISNKVKISHLKCQLLTGRTHQIRVHMSYIGNLIGDNTTVEIIITKIYL